MDHDHHVDETQVQRAILQALIYADIFDYPLAANEIRRYLTLPASTALITRVLEVGSANGLLHRRNGYFTLPDKAHLVPLRQHRSVIAREKWRRARWYAGWIARMPFVRMIAVTGTLAVNNVEATDDIDLFIVTQPGRLWLCRGLVILIVHLAALRGDDICPNYFLSEDALALPECNYFTARELTQMVPLYGERTYYRMRRMNAWTEEYLPQAQGAADGFARPVVLGSVERCLKRAGEWLLNGRLGAAIERWEMQRKIRKFSQQAAAGDSSVAFTADCCKGHFDHHDQVILDLFRQRLAAYGLEEELSDD